MIPTIQVDGGPGERGRQYGEQARDRVHRSIAAYRDVFAHYTGWDWPRVTREAARFESPIVEFGPEYLAEMQGIAAGARVAVEDILALNVRTEVMFAAKARQAAAQSPPAECTAFALLPAASANGHTLIGQYWDWLPHCFDTVVLLQVRRDDGPDFVTVVEAGLLAKTGMNSAGIGLATNALATDADRGSPGVPYHVLLRSILDCETVSDALAAIQRRARSAAANYLIAHPDGIVLDVEAAPGDFSRIFLLFPERGILLHTNHYLSPAFDAKDVSLWVMPDSPVRLERVRRAVAGTVGPLGVEALQTMLADHANYPSGVCCHPDLRMAPADQGATVASLIMDLVALRMWLADGPPCVTPFRELDFAAFLAKPPSVREAVPG